MSIIMGLVLIILSEGLLSLVETLLLFEVVFGLRWNFETEAGPLDFDPPEAPCRRIDRVTSLLSH